MGGALKNRVSGEVIERNVDKLAQFIFQDPKADQDWLATVDRILQHLPQGIKNPRLAQWRGDMAKKYPHMKEGSTDWFKAIKQKLAV